MTSANLQLGTVSITKRNSIIEYGNFFQKFKFPAKLHVSTPTCLQSINLPKIAKSSNPVETKATNTFEVEVEVVDYV